MLIEVEVTVCPAEFVVVMVVTAVALLASLSTELVTLLTFESILESKLLNLDAMEAEIADRVAAFVAVMAVSSEEREAW